MSARIFILTSAAAVAVFAADRVYPATLDPEPAPLAALPDFTVEDVIAAFPELAGLQTVRPEPRPCEPLPSCLRDLPVVMVGADLYLDALPYAGRNYSHGGVTGGFPPARGVERDHPVRGGGRDEPVSAAVPLPSSWGLLAGVMSLFALCGIWHRCDDLETIR